MARPKHRHTAWAEEWHDRVVAQIVTDNAAGILSARTIVAHMDRIGQPLPGDETDQLGVVTRIMRRARYAKLPTSRGVQMYGDYANAAWRGVRLKP